VLLKLLSAAATLAPPGSPRVGTSVSAAVRAAVDITKFLCGDANAAAVTIVGREVVGGVRKAAIGHQQDRQLPTSYLGVS
jgi:hypothetical protein